MGKVKVKSDSITSNMFTDEFEIELPNKYHPNLDDKLMFSNISFDGKKYTCIIRRGRETNIKLNTH